MPMIMAPRHWLSAVFMLITRPQSCTHTILLILTIPVSVSTETSAIMAPHTPLLFRLPGPGFLPTTWIGSVPSLEQAWLQLRLRLGSDFTRILPPTDSSSSGLAFSAGAILAKSWFSASTAARRVAGATPPMVVLPPEPPDAGYWLSPMFNWIF